jgi:hypothetical protein
MPRAGGAGKTTIAELVFEHLQCSYAPKRPAFVKLEAGEQVDPAPYLRQALQALWVEPTPGGYVRQHQGQLYDLAARQPLLLVVDNVWSADQMKALLPPRLASGGRVLMTTRAADLGKSPELQYQVTKQTASACAILPGGSWRVVLWSYSCLTIISCVAPLWITWTVSDTAYGD